MGVTISSSRCIGCAGCVAVCPTLALTLVETRIECDDAKCTNCQICIKGCPTRAISLKT